MTSTEHRFASLYAERAAALRPSPVRSVWDLSMEPGMISLAGGNPDLEVLPLAWLGATAEALIRDHGLSALQYGPGAGLPALREAITTLVRGAGIEVSPDDVLVTAGSQMGLELITSLLCDPGDVVLTEAPTYAGAVSVFEGLQADVVHVECDDAGLVPAALERTIATVRGEGRTIKLLYAIPNFANPSGITLAEERRPAIARVCADAGIALVEDDPYGLIQLEGTSIPAIRSLDASVLYLGSMSKIFSPGIRLGWVIAPSDVRARLQLASEATTIHASTLSQHLAARYLIDGDWRAHLDRAIDRYRERALAMVAALEEHMPRGTTWTTPHGGFFVWVTLPEGCSAEALLEDAIDEHVVFIPGTAFYADGDGDRHVRLSFSLESPAAITEGVARLGRALARQLPA